MIMNIIILTLNDTESTNQSNINGNGLVDMEKYNKYLNLVKEKYRI